MSDWKEILREAVEARGAAEVARELGISKTTISLVLSGKYGAATDRIEEKVTRIYAAAGVDCPILGQIEPGRCADIRERARKIGLKAGNPETLRLYKTCFKCGLNGG